MIDKTLPHSELTGKVIGAAMKVHTALGNGFMEVIYQNALEKEFEQQGVVFSREHEMPIRYNGEVVGSRRVDFLVDGIIAVELKAIIELEDVHIAQALNYLEAFNLQVGLLINFGSTRLTFHRLRNKKFRSDVTMDR